MENVRGHSKVPNQEHRHGEGYSNTNKIPTVQKFNEEERRKREEAKKQENMARKKGLARVVRDPVTGGQIEIKDSSGDHEFESSNMYVTVPRKNVVSGGDESDVKKSTFNSEGTRFSDLQQDFDSDSHHKLRDQVEHLLGRSSSKASRSSRSGTATTHGDRNNVLDSKQDQRNDKGQTNAHDEDGWVDLPMRGKRSNIMVSTSMSLRLSH